MLLKQAERIRSDGFQPEVIVGISRGGWVPARVLSDFLENPNLANAKVEYYVGINETKKAPKLTQCISTEVNGKTILIVDEVADWGESLKLATAHAADRGARKVKTATLYYKPWSIFKPDYYGKETRCWIVFPWEINETVQLICETHRTNRAEAEKELMKLSEAGVSNRMIKHFLKEFSDSKNAKTN
jgi:hypoxanthine phosphoribosyltransferase